MGLKRITITCVLSIKINIGFGSIEKLYSILLLVNRNIDKDECKIVSSVFICFTCNSKLAF